MKRIELLSQVGFYRQDIESLETLGYDVVATNSLWKALRSPGELVLIWWWTHALIPILASRLVRRRPAIVTGVFNYEGITGYTFSERPIWQRCVIRLAARFSSANVFVSDYEADVVSAAFGLSDDTTHTVPLEVSSDVVEAFTPISEREDFFLQIAWTGTHNLRRKCVLETIDACERYAARHAGVTLVIVGNEGDGHRMLEQRCKELRNGLTVRFLGRVDELTKIELLRTCRVYISPSRFEGFGLAIAEAMATGAPTITSPVGAIPEVFGDTAEFCDGTRPESILEAMIRMDDPAHRDELSVKGRSLVLDKYSPGIRAQGLKAVLARLLDMNPPHGVDA